MKTKSQITKRRNHFESVINKLHQEVQDPSTPKERVQAIELELRWRQPELRAMDWVLSKD